MLTRGIQFVCTVWYVKGPKTSKNKYSMLMFIHILMSFCMEYMCIVAVKPLNTILGGDMKANIHGTSILTCLLPRLKI